MNRISAKYITKNYPERARLYGTMKLGFASKVIL